MRISNVTADVEKKTEETLRLNLKISDLSSLANVICKGEGIGAAELRSGLRKRRVVKTRRIFCQIAIKKMGYSGADVARFLGISTSAVNRLAVSHELPEIFNTNKPRADLTPFYPNDLNCPLPTRCQKKDFINSRLLGKNSHCR